MDPFKVQQHLAILNWRENFVNDQGLLDLPVGVEFQVLRVYMSRFVDEQPFVTMVLHGLTPEFAMQANHNSFRVPLEYPFNTSPHYDALFALVEQARHHRELCHATMTISDVADIPIWTFGYKTRQDIIDEAIARELEAASLQDGNEQLEIEAIAEETGEEEEEEETENAEAPKALKADVDFLDTNNMYQIKKY